MSDDLSILFKEISLVPLPKARKRSENIAHAPNRCHHLSHEQKKQALSNALRYFPTEYHKDLAHEFAQELKDYGHIYMYRFLPPIPLRAFPLIEIPCKIKAAGCIIHMILNNLDGKVAQFPEELVTYGGNGQVFSNWAQFRLTIHYLSIMEDEQTLVMYSGHPLGLFPSSQDNPKLIITNGMVIPNYSSRENYDEMFALGVSMYGQMTAGSYCYIGPQGIVHGTVLTLLNAGRKYLKVNSLKGRVFVTSGLGGMSGAQGKASVICDCIGVIAEVSYEALRKRFAQGWIEEIIDGDLDLLIHRIRDAIARNETTSIGFHGNIVSVWERLAKELETNSELLVALGSDQTSCHNVFNGGYYPVQISYEEAHEMMTRNFEDFKKLVQESLKRQIVAINKLSEAGMFFWDYGNSFLLEAQRAGANVNLSDSENTLSFRYPSYVQDIMGDIFALGFGPFRWVCVTGNPEDLKKTDEIALQVLQKMIADGIPSETAKQYEDNIRWLQEADKHNLVVGSQARILYSDQCGRVQIAMAFNEAIHSGFISGEIVISRDHHDVSGTDSPFRETSDIKDGSAFTADMAIQNCIGDAFRGASWVAIHNGGGCGWGEVINGGFGLVLDGSKEASKRAQSMLNWDVSNGVARRSWCGNEIAKATIVRTMAYDDKLQVTLPNISKDSDLLNSAIEEAFLVKEFH